MIFFAKLNDFWRSSKKQYAQPKQVSSNCSFYFDEPLCFKIKIVFLRPIYFKSPLFSLGDLAGDTKNFPNVYKNFNQSLLEMTLKDIASVAGKSGLYKVLKPSRTGVLLESIDDKKAKMIANTQQRVSILKEVSIFSTNAEGSVSLQDTFLKIQEKYADKVTIDTSNNKTLISFIAEIVPDYDKEKVYPSDIKKLINWYNILAQYYPEVFTAKEEEPINETAESKEEESPVAVETVAESKAE